MHDTLNDIYTHHCIHEHIDLASGDDTLTKLIAKVKIAFERAAQYLHGKKKYTPSMLADDEIKQVITTTNEVLRQAISKNITHKMPARMRQELQKNTFFFSGMKIHAEMTEVSALLTDEKGNLKPLSQFTEDVKKIDDTYNENYLRAERNFATRSSQMAAKWSEYEKGKNRYNLKYLTDNGPNVRDTHRELEGTVLPVDDPFWDKYTPPIDWNCHCFLVQTRKDEEPVSDSAEAMTKGEVATTRIGKDGTNKAEIFRFNPGKEMKVMPPDHPYTSGNCKDLGAIWYTLSTMQKVYLADSADKCKAKKVVNEMVKKFTIEEKQKVYNLPEEHQYKKDKNGVFRHIMIGTSESDLPDRLMAANELKKKGATPFLLPEIHYKETTARKKLFPEYDREKTNPDIRIKETNEYWEIERSLGTSKRNIRQRINSAIRQADNVYLILNDKKHKQYAEYLLKKKAKKYIIK